MSALIDKINQIEFPIGGEELLFVLNKSHELSTVYLSEDECFLLRQDLDFFYHGKSRWFVHNTFSGGIIFLREPETIEIIQIQFWSDKNEAVASVMYSSEKRNARNVKYKPDAGQIESQVWNMPGIFPNFNKYKEYGKLVLMAIIGKFTKHICETRKRDSWFMQYEKPFEIELLLDNKLELTYSVLIEQ